MVDYDLRRRELEHAKSKAKVNDQKVQQAEETHTQAKQLYDEITDELYEELPTLYDRYELTRTDTVDTCWCLLTLLTPIDACWC